jgi:type I restriction enzyme S subunit
MDGEFRVRKWRSGKGLLNQRVCRLVPNGGPMVADFLYYSIGKPLKQIEDFTPFTTVKHISAGQIRAIELPLPPLPEQKKIAHILSTVQRAIEAQERIIQTTTELKKALMHKLFTEGLRNEPQKQTEIGLVPVSWEVVEIGDLGKCVTGSTPKTKVGSFYDPPSEDFIAPADLGARRYVYDSEKKISPEGMATIRPLPKNAVMCVCIGSSIGKVGMSYREKSATNQQINSIICKKGRDPEFVYYLLSYHWEYWKSFATFGPVPILSKGRFATIVVAIPSSVEEQQAIAKPLVVLEAKVEVAEKKVAALKDLFRTLLHELMTAKTRVHELQLEMTN